MTELIWDGKYDAKGKRTAPVRIALPFQTVETVNESARERQLTLDSMIQGRESAWRNRLIWGDKKYVLPSLLPEFAGKVDLIYIDPPFDTGADFSFTTQIPESDASFTKVPSIIEQKAYRDTWGRGLDGYLQWFYETAALLHQLLSEKGSIYVHLDWHVGHYAKAVLDEVFGRENFQNELIWQRTSAHNDTHKYGINFDSMFFFSKSQEYTWNIKYHKYSDKQLAKYKSDDDDRQFTDSDLTARGKRNGSSGQPWRGFDPGSQGNHWAYGIETLEKLDEEGRIYWSKRGGYPRLKVYLDEDKGTPVQAIWTDIGPVNSQATERVDYRTQKPLALLERILNASSNPGDLVLDCFCGSGTTAVAAEKLGRRWITCDLGRFAVHTARKRLLGMPNVRPFAVQNLGKYERQAWQAAEFGTPEQGTARQMAYRRFILDLYRATPLDGYAYIHGIKAGRFVHVGSVDAPVTVEDVKALARECWKASGRGAGEATNAADVLAWDFAFEVNERAKAIAADANVNLSFKRIPREVLEKKAVDQGDIRFFELAALSLDVAIVKDTVTLTLRDFMVPPDDVPAEIQRAISNWEQWIDYWAVDWDFRDDTFHNQWQSYRTRHALKLQKQIGHQYDESGTYTIVVKAIDILGNDTTKSIQVKVG